ncbi:M1 family metallopeptidase [uncultured Paludibaculum sp.]|uniref:M1 family metallopeptidase n=1 Tax=uncultured Paludibaculum sp. TaxID=1765020 RepID=UPI002AAB5E09|nr:M1 family metallopeptidase [uncultured Paludibaculum sp.]
MKMLRLISCLLMAMGLPAATPVRYSVDLTIVPERPEFSGVARITVKLDAGSTGVTLNAKDLVPGNARVSSGGRTVAARARVLNPEEIRVEWVAPLGPGEAEVEIAYQGRMDDKLLVGPYRRQVDGAWYVFTTFTAIEARRAFPCFDEPHFKTPWKLTLHVRREHQAFSNTGMETETPEPDGMKAMRFAATAPLPSELVAFAVGPFDTLEGHAAGQKKVPVRVVTPRGRSQQGRYAADVTDTLLARLERYTGIPYPSGKLDHVALPEGAYGAVENPGLITYQQRGLLAEPGKDTPEWRARLRGLMTHELAHQWFGNLVTQAGWQDVWLSEGFATWLAGRMMDDDSPAAERNLAAVAARERIMAVDSVAAARPVRLAMRGREELSDVYSRMVYQKGAAVLLMLEGWQGEQRFRQELQSYLKQRQFGVATTDDLAKALGTAATLHTFLDQPGIPKVEVTARCENGRGRLMLAQQDKAKNWSVPVCWRTDRARACTVLESGEQTVPLNACPAWVFGNAGGTGYYRTVWSEGQLKVLTAGGLAQLTAAEKLTLVYDLQAGGVGASVLSTLAADAQPRVARAAAEALRAVAPKEPTGEKP